MSGHETDSPDAHVDALQQPEGETRHERYRVKLGVRLLRAEDYLIQYAENLSQGGLFIAGAQNLNPLDEVSIRLDLPGLGAYDLVCRVAHVLDEEAAERNGRSAGAGFAIMSSPPEFRGALSEYLLLLGGRRDTTVLVADSTTETLLTSAGYRVKPNPPPAGIANAVSSTPHVIAVVVPKSLAARYRQALIEADLPDIVLEADSDSPPDDLLNLLDKRVRAIKGT